MNAAPHPAKIFWLLTRLRLIRLANLTGTRMRLSALRKGKTRTGTAPKSKLGAILTIVVTLLMLANFVNLTRQSMLNLYAHTAVVQGVQLQPGAFEPGLIGGLSLILLLLAGVGVLSDVGARELANPEWDMEWLVTLPIRTDTLLWGRIVERAASSAFGLVTLWPLCAMIAFYSGLGWWSVVVGAVALAPVLLLMALTRTMIDVGLRVRLAPPQLRNLQALMSVVAVLVLYLVVSTITPNRSTVMALVDAFPPWATWLPTGLVVRALNAQTMIDALTCGFLLCAEVALLLVLGMQWLRYQLRNGLLANGSRESARSVTPARALAVHANTTLAPADRKAPFWLLRSAVQRRELTLLSRDRNFMVQTLVLPVVVVGAQFALNMRADTFVHMLSSISTAASIAFGIAAYMLMLSAFQNLNNEGGALWMLYGFPRSIASVLREKAQLWMALSMVYPGLVLIAGIYFSHDSAWHDLGYSALTLLGVAIYVVIAVALGVFASNPLAQEKVARVRPSYLYLFMLLSGMYTYAIAAAAWWQSLVFAVLAILLALALWQKAMDHLPYLLDPVAAPPPRVSTSDGLMAAMMFFVFQIMIALLAVAMRGKAHKVGAPDLMLSFVSAGALTYLLIRLVYWRSKTSQVPTVFKGGHNAPLTTGALAGLFAGAIGVAYLWTVLHFEVLDLPTLSVHQRQGHTLLMWMLALTVVAAPIFEEFIFRGLIFGGLRRSVGLLPSAVASAAVFAAVHPAASILPVFALGVCAALAYERTQTLRAPMLTHAVYNAMVVGYQVVMNA